MERPLRQKATPGTTVSGVALLSDKNKVKARQLPSRLASLLLVVLIALQVTSNTAYGMDTNRVTARPNDTSKRLVLGGRPTRITWVGDVSPGEEVTSITLIFPEGCFLADNSYVTVREMLMDDPQHPGRNLPEYSEELDADHLYLVFDSPIRENNQLYIEIFGFCFPEGDGSYSITGSYTDGTRKSHVLSEQPIQIPVYKVTRTQKIIELMKTWKWVEVWNSVLFLKVFLNPIWFVAAIPVVIRGWLVSLFLVLLAFPLACPIGLGFSFLRMSRFRVLRAIASVWVNIIRGTPLFLQVYIAFFGLPLLGVRIGNYPLGIFVFAFNSSAYLAEIFRAGIQSINKGQFEAASSLGMTGFQTMFSVIIPQTVRRVIPTMTSEFILLYKDTSLLSAVGVMEQMMFAKSLANTSANLTPYVVSAFFYLLVTLPLTKVISVFEKKLAATEGRAEPPEDAKKAKARFRGRTVEADGAVEVPEPDALVEVSASYADDAGADSTSLREPL